MKYRKNHKISQYIPRSIDSTIKPIIIGLTLGLATTIASYFFTPNIARAQGGAESEAKEDLISKIKKYTTAINAYEKNNQTAEAKKEKEKLRKEILGLESNLEETVRVLEAADSIISDKTFVKYLTNLNISIPKGEEEKLEYLLTLRNKIYVLLSTREQSAQKETLTDLKLGKLFLYRILTKEFPEIYSSEKEKIEKEIQNSYAKSDSKGKKNITNLLELYELNFNLQEPEKITPPPKKPTPAPKKVTPAPKKTTTVPKKTTRTPKKTTRAPKKTTRTPKKTIKEKPFVPPQKSLEDQVLSLENKAVGKLMESLSETDPLKRIRLQEEALRWYHEAENKDKSTKGYATDINDIKKQILKEYAKWLMTEQNPKTFETGLVQAKRTLGEHKAKELKKQLRFSDARKKSGTKVINNQVSIETTAGRNVDSTVAYERLRINYDILHQILQQRREERIINTQNEEQVTQEDIGQVDININKLRARIICAGGRDSTTRRTLDFDDSASLTHTIKSITRYKLKTTKDFGGILAQIDLKGLTPISIIAGLGYEMTTTATTVKIVNEIINLGNPNGSYPEEVLTELENGFRESMILIGGDKIIKKGKAGVRIGHKRIIERQGLGDQRTVRNTDKTWVEARTQLMLNKSFGISGIVLRESIKDELLQPGIIERSRQNDKFSQVRGGGAIAATIPESGITAFARYVHTEFCDKGAAGIVITTNRHNGTAASLLEMLTHETELDLGILPGQTGKVKDLLNSVNLSKLSLMTQTGNKLGFGFAARADVWNVPGGIPAWIGTIAATLDMPDGSIIGSYNFHSIPEGKIMELRLGYLSPSRRIHLELILREFQSKTSKDAIMEMGAGFALSF